jgi:hypothetical protein
VLVACSSGLQGMSLPGCLSNIQAGPAGQAGGYVAVSYKYFSAILGHFFPIQNNRPVRNKNFLDVFFIENLLFAEVMMKF